MNTLSDMIDTLIREADIAALPEWDGIPLGRPVFDYHPPEELDAAWHRWIDTHGTFNSLFLSKMWHRSHTVPHTTLGQHSIDHFDINLRCAASTHDRQKHGLGRICECVGGMLTQIICTECTWHTIADDENAAIETWHDHAFPGWRNLPTLPAKLRGKMGATKMTPKLEEWFEANYPASFRTPGAPIITERGPYGTRAVNGYSPYGGYDLAAPHVSHTPATIN